MIKLTRLFFTNLSILALSQFVPVQNLLANDISTLPDPLTLEQALTLSQEQHPDIAAIKARILSSEAKLLQAESHLGLQSYLNINAETIKLSGSEDFENDSYAQLIISKPVFDWGHSTALQKAETTQISSQKILLTDRHVQKQFEIISNFYNVILADMKYLLDNENSVRNFLAYDKKRDRHSLGMISDAELNEYENKYREALSFRMNSETRRKSTRLLLAMALNRPADLPTNLTPPALLSSKQSLPDSFDLYKTALKNNRTIISMEQQVTAAKNRLIAERKRDHPKVTANFEVAEYERATSSRSDVRASINIHIPLYQGKASQAAIARSSADLAAITAQLQQTQYKLLENIMTLVNHLTVLYAEKSTARQRIDYRDINLDHHRARYELELQTDFSHAQTNLTEANWLATKLEYDISLAWIQLNLLTGKPLRQQEIKSQ